MIILTRLNGTELALNPDLIHRAEETPDTVLTLIDGSRYVVVEPLSELISRVVGYRARVVAEAGLLADAALLAPAPVDHADRVHDDRPDDRADDRADLTEEPGGRRSGASVVQLRARRA